VTAESARQWVHIGSGLFALLLRFLTWWQAALLAAAALVFNVIVLPLIGGRRLYRPIDEARGFPIGILLYPLSVLLLIAALPERLDIVAAAWGVLAFGDGFATLIGRRTLATRHARAATTPKRKDATAARAARASTNAEAEMVLEAARSTLPWNREKTIAGTVAFVVFGSVGAVALACWVRPSVSPQPPLMFAFMAPVVAAAVAALVETIPIRLDDNISVPLSAAAVMWLASHITLDALAASRQAIAMQLPWAIGINALVAWLGYRSRTVSTSGAIGGTVIGAVIYAAGGAPAWALLFTTFVVASVTSRLGLERKALLGIAEEHGGRRGAGNAFANCGVAAVAALAAVATPHPVQAWIAFVAALTAGGSDTVASEIGKAWGRATFLVPSLTRVRPGTPGAMSLEGTAAGLVAAFAFGALAGELGLIAANTILPVVIGASAGALVESALGATLEAPGIVNNDVLNFINTAVAAAVALAMA
jgi:uncharacterized protein (TIGR00297 family)